MPFAISGSLPQLTNVLVRSTRRPGRSRHPQSRPVHAGGDSARIRVKMACTNCKLAKARCDNGRPCSRCVKRGCADSCVDAIPKRRGPRQHGSKRGHAALRARSTAARSAGKNASSVRSHWSRQRRGRVPRSKYSGLGRRHIWDTRVPHNERPTGDTDDIFQQRKRLRVDSDLGSVPMPARGHLPASHHFPESTSFQDPPPVYLLSQDALGGSGLGHTSNPLSDSELEALLRQQDGSVHPTSPLSQVSRVPGNRETDKGSAGDRARATAGAKGGSGTIIHTLFESAVTKTSSQEKGFRAAAASIGSEECSDSSGTEAGFETGGEERTGMGVEPMQTISLWRLADPPECSAEPKSLFELPDTSLLQPLAVWV